MADVKISQLPAATTPLDGTEVLPIVQSATTKQVSIANVTAGRAVSALSLSLTNALPVTSGGTGISTTAAGTLLSSTALNTISATATPTLGVAGTTAGTLGLSGVTSGVVTLATADAAGTWTMKLPTSGGTNGYILTTNGSGVTSWTNPTALGIDLDVGTTAITAGTTGRVLYDNAGVLGEYTSVPVGFGGTGTSTTFTAGSVVFAGASGIYGQDNTNLFWDDTNNWLGIGLNSPAYRLDITSNVAAVARLTGSTDNTQLIFKGSTTNANLIGIGTNIADSGTGANFDIFNYTTSTNLLRITSAGNLGLGVTPSAWNAAIKTLQVGRAASIQNGGSNDVYFGSNYYYGSGFTYINNGYASYYMQDSGRHIWFNAPSGTAGGTVTFTQAMTLDASGQLVIGGTSGSEKLHVYGNIQLQTTSKIQFYNTGYFIKAQNGLEIASADYINFQINGTTPAARIDSSGNLLVGTTSVPISSARRGISVVAPSGAYVAGMFKNDGGNSAQTIDVWNAATSGNNVFLNFITESSPTERGSIYYDRAAGQTKLLATSDYRAKDIGGLTVDALSVVNSMKVRDAKLKWAEGNAYPMFIAHELQDAAPWAVTGEKDAVGDDGKPKYQSVDAASLVPTLAAAIQELAAKVSALEAKQ